ncbi:MAG TPA: sodium:solute symporter family protein, partial [Ignavibacteriaceae bacterium]|nr:sodium:solute symporter family protein [Ignavibacteriaceae bacterium]
PGARFLVTILQLMYLIGYSAIGFLTMAKALEPMLPPAFNFLGMHFDVTLMGVVTVTAVVTGAYITFGGQTAVIFTDLVQGFMLMLAGFLVFFIGIAYVGGWSSFWNLLPTTWKLPLADFNKPADFNFVGIFWQDGIAGSIGFLFMNMGLIMRFMATKSVDEGRKAAIFNILILPLSAIVVSSGGWIGKAISVLNPKLIPANTDPDSIYVLVSSIIMSPGFFGFIIASLAAALMSTVSTYINASAAIWINDVDRPLRIWLKKIKKDAPDDEKRNLLIARIATVVFTILAILTVIPFSHFKTVYEAHGYFHSTLTPPLVIAIFLGIFWKRFSPMGVITTLIGGIAIMFLGAYYPYPLVWVMAQGIPMAKDHPYIYIEALYNTLACFSVAILVTIFTKPIGKAAEMIRKNPHHKRIITTMIVLSVIIFIIIAFDLTHLAVMMTLAWVLVALVSITSAYHLPIKAETYNTGLTVWDIQSLKLMFKGGKINDREGSKVKVNWRLKDEDKDLVHFSKKEMELMAADVGDLVYLTDHRKWLGGLKSVHSRIGEPHNEEGIVYINKDQLQHALFVEGKMLEAEKEM